MNISKSPLTGSLAAFYIDNKNNKQNHSTINQNCKCKGEVGDGGGGGGGRRKGGGRGRERQRQRATHTERQKDRRTDRQTDRQRQRIHVNTHHILCQGPQTTLHFDVTSQHNSIGPLQTPISHRIALHSPRFTLVVSAAKEKTREDN